jgi:hypothetical protein
MVCNLLRSFLANLSPEEGRGIGWLPVNVGSGVKASFLCSNYFFCCPFIDLGIRRLN